jgi:1-acyl-sn-glycerol-3-phosphate acyltransferase
MGYVYQLCRSLSHGMAQLVFDYRVENPEKLDVDGPLLIASNHASYLDPPLVGVAFRKELHYLARNTLYSNAFARWLFPRLNVVPVDQDKAEVGPLKAMLRLLKEGKQCIIFPEGSRSPDGKLLPAEGGAGFVVAKAGVPVLPVRIFGAWESLPPGTSKLEPRKITVVVGDVLRFTEAELKREKGKDVYKEISERILGEIGKLQCSPDRKPRPRVVAKLKVYE